MSCVIFSREATAPSCQAYFEVKALANPLVWGLLLDLNPLQARQTPAPSWELQHWGSQHGILAPALGLGSAACSGPQVPPRPAQVADPTKQLAPRLFIVVTVTDTLGPESLQQASSSQPSTQFHRQNQPGLRRFVASRAAQTSLLPGPPISAGSTRPGTWGWECQPDLGCPGLWGKARLRLLSACPGSAPFCVDASGLLAARRRPEAVAPPTPGSCKAPLCSCGTTLPRSGPTPGF